MLQFDFEESLGYWVCSTSHAFRRALNAELAKEIIQYRTQYTIDAINKSIANKGTLPAPARTP